MNHWIGYCDQRGKRSWAPMSAAFVLLALSAATGLVLGMLFSWLAIAASSIGLAILSAVVLQITGFGALSGIAIIVACLTVNQLAYAIGVVLANRRSKEPRKHARAGPA
jgi:membrane protein implicated in regulation of membrane protease activity